MTNANSFRIGLNPIKNFREVATIRCAGKYGEFTTTVDAREDQTAEDAISSRIENLESRGNRILQVIRKE